MMNEKDLQELKEMTGLVSESELNNAKHEAAPAPCKPMYDRQAKAAIVSKELASYVGRFVKVGKTYGIIDDVHGNMLGYVHCENDTWTGELVWARRRHQKGSRIGIGVFHKGACIGLESHREEDRYGKRAGHAFAHALED